MFYQVWGMNIKNTIEKKAVLQLAVLSKGSQPEAEGNKK